MKTTTFDHENYPGENVAILTPAPAEDVFGFYGTVKSMTDDEEMAEFLWESASLVLSSFYREDDPAVVRNFLRSRYGRHLADRITFFAKPHEYKNFDVMREAVMSAIMEKDHRGRSMWGKLFAEIKKIIENGEWVD
jgi:hypothetical protein